MQGSTAPPQAVRNLNLHFQHPHLPRHHPRYHHHHHPAGVQGSVRLNFSAGRQLYPLGIIKIMMHSYKEVGHTIAMTTTANIITQSRVWDSHSLLHLDPMALTPSMSSTSPDSPMDRAPSSLSRSSSMLPSSSSSSSSSKSLSGMRDPTICPVLP